MRVWKPTQPRTPEGLKVAKMIKKVSSYRDLHVLRSHLVVQSLAIQKAESKAAFDALKVGDLITVVCGSDCASQANTTRVRITKVLKYKFKVIHGPSKRTGTIYRRDALNYGSHMSMWWDE